MAKHLTDKEKKEIIAYYVECGNARETARKFDVSDTTVNNIINENNDQNLQKFAQKAEENTQDVLKAMESRAKKKIELLDKLLDGMEEKANNLDIFTNIKDLATAYGIILDKEFKGKELRMKREEMNGESKVHRVEIINDLPKDSDED